MFYHSLPYYVALYYVLFDILCDAIKHCITLCFLCNVVFIWPNYIISYLILPKLIHKQMLNFILSNLAENAKRCVWLLRNS